MSTVTIIKNLTDNCETLKARVAQAKTEYETVKSLCGQTGYGITIAGVRVEVAEMDARTYMAKMIRGREMIHLGALKALDARVDTLNRKLSESIQMLTDAAQSLANNLKANQEKGHAE